MGSQLALKSRIASTASLEKIFNAQEMIASSHIAKARDVALNAKPYTDAIFDAVQALVAHTHIDHPIVKKDEDNPRVAVLALTSDRGMAGPYTSSIIRETESLLARLDAAGKQPELSVYGRRGVTYYKYRNRPVAGTWEGDTDQPGVEIAETISMHRSDVSKAIAKLEAEGIIVRGPKAGRSATFRLNPAFGWKGSAANHQKALKERMKASNISGIVPARDPNTVDFIAGRTDAERGK